MRAFEVSAVELGTQPLRSISLAESLKSRGGTTDASAGNVGGIVRSSGHAFLSAVHTAFCNHFPLALSPDDVWLCIAQGFGIHVVANAESLRKRFVRHAGKVTLTVGRGPQDDDWSGVFAEFSDKLAAHLGKTRDLVVAGFSTTGAIERAAFQIVLMGAMQEYFEYECSLCGIPRICLLGTPADWQNVYRRSEALAEFELKEWVDVLLPVLEQFVAASQGSVDPVFWRSFYKVDDSSGGPFVTGWINALFPYRQELTQSVDGHAVTWRYQPAASGTSRTSDFPPGLSRVPVKFTFTGSEAEGAFFGGFVGVAQDPDTLGVRPVIGWAVTSGRQSAELAS